MKAAIILFPGSNREGDVYRALAKASGRKPALVWHGEHDLPQGTDLVVLPGGFSYGDYLRCGAIAARAPIMDGVRAHAARGGLVLGICNGFQILCESFTAHYRKHQVIKVAIAHGEGNYTADGQTIARLEDAGRIAFRYCNGEAALGGLANPNGSMNDIAGIYSEKLNVLGLMPHPENLVDPLVGGTDGLALFESLAAA